MPKAMRLIPLVIALLAGCATVTNPVTGQRELTVMDERSEIAEGRKAHEEVLQEFGAYANPRLQAYVSELGQRLAKQSHRSNLAWHFTVLDSPEVNGIGRRHVRSGCLTRACRTSCMGGLYCGITDFLHRNAVVI